MAKTLPALDASLIEFIESQHVFFVASAPSGEDGHVNLSPKGYDSFRVLDERTVAYVDLIGSGVETISHLRQNGRITLLFCAFEGKPNLVRLYGRGEVFEPGDGGFEALASRFPARRGVRAVIRIDVERVATSCGYSVPNLVFEAERPTLDRWVARRDDESLAQYQAEHNASSIDGLPSGLAAARGA